MLPPPGPPTLQGLHHLFIDQGRQRHRPDEPQRPQHRVQTIHYHPNGRRGLPRQRPNPFFARIDVDCRRETASVRKQIDEPVSQHRRDAVRLEKPRGLGERHRGPEPIEQRARRRVGRRRGRRSGFRSGAVACGGCGEDRVEVGWAACSGGAAERGEGAGERGGGGRRERGEEGRGKFLAGHGGWGTGGRKKVGRNGARGARGTVGRKGARREK
mmetsp:Transcript_22886/g.60772  ORF Transcript_22886/g.60772 Transcript_22886/m.60772 type:complete len:214 (-) Transcript_22886:2-643(-)